jgi:hypothetical protein
MSVISQAADIPKAIVKPLLNPKTLLIGAGLTMGYLAVLSYLLPGLGQLVGVRPNPILPKLHDSLNVWPFAAGSMPGSATPASAGATSSGASQEALGRAIVASSVNSAQGYIDSMLQVI